MDTTPPPLLLCLAQVNLLSSLFLFKQNGILERGFTMAERDGGTILFVWQVAWVYIQYEKINAGLKVEWKL